MKTKIILAVILVAAGCLLASRFSDERPVVEKSVPKNPAHESSVAQSEPAPIPAPVNLPPPEEHTNGAAAPTKADGPPKLKKQNSGKLPTPKEAVQDPVARVALSFVGADPDAEAYWASAINNPDLPGEERKDLIEDLNEDGFSDPKHPGPEDMELIVNRLQLIEEFAPDAMDQVNADAFAEAYKDLVNMLNGKPVQ